MLNTSQLNDILEGIALLEYFGNLYEYAGMEAGKYIFQCVSDDSYIKVTAESLRTLPEYDIQY